MADVEIPFGDKPADTAVLLLAAAESLDLPVESVRTGAGVFVVSEEIADEAGLGEKPKPKRK